jgi:cell division septal protein FtsQ
MHKHIGANRRKKYGDQHRRIRKAMTTAVSKGVVGSRFIAIAVVVIGGASYGALRLASWMKTSPLFTVSSMTVEGTSRIEKSEILRLSGIKPGMRIMSINPGAAQRAIAQNPWVKQVTVARHFPGTVAICVRERVPIALVNVGNVCYADDDGKLLPLFKGTYSDLPLITGIRGARMDSVACVEKQSFERVKRFLDQCKAVDAAFAKRLSQIDFSGDPVIRMSLDDVPVVIELNDADTKTSVARLKQLVESVQGSVKGTPKHINLCYENLAYLRW